MSLAGASLSRSPGYNPLRPIPGAPHDSEGSPVMRDNERVFDLDFGRRDMRAERPMFRILTRGRATLLLAAAIGLPWLPSGDPMPDGLPMLRYRGRSGAMIWRFALSPDGQTIATVDEMGQVRLRPAGQGEGIERDLDVSGQAKALAFSPDGRFLAVGREESDVFLFDLRRGGQRRPLGIPIRDIRHLRFAPDGQTLALSRAPTPERATGRFHGNAAA